MPGRTRASRDEQQGERDATKARRDAAKEAQKAKEQADAQLQGAEPAADPEAEPEATDPKVADATGGDPGTVEQEGLGGAGEMAPSGVSETEDLPPLSVEEYGAAIASSVGGTDNYPYVDRSAVPVHERNLSAVNNPLTEASQAELNPAFTPKAEDGGPVTEDNKSIGTEPNAYDRALANVENAGGDVEAAKEQLDGTDQQMDAQKVTDEAKAREDAAKNGEPLPAGAPSGMEPHPDGSEGTAGAGEPDGEGTSQDDAPTMQ